MNYRERYKLWLREVPESDRLHAQLISIGGNEEEIRERFFDDMHFGTAGLRGIIGVGTMCMNVYTVGRASRGIAEYICQAGEEARKRGVIVVHDPRHFSREFSLLASCIFARSGITVYTFPSMRSTPQLACLVRRLNTVSGINITASHNPPEYNGYKVYWEDGCQVSSDVAYGMTKKIDALDYFIYGAKGISLSSSKRVDVNWDDYQDMLSDGRIIELGEKEDRIYFDMVENLAIHKGEELDLAIPIVYTPLNGAGTVPISVIMKDRGFTNFRIVPEQKDPDPDFKTVGYPNPEDAKAFRLSEELGRKMGAELLMATDPDADRFAAELWRGDGTYIPLNGNQTGYLLVNYILEGRKEACTLPKKGAMVKSIVTSSMSTEIAGSYGVRMFEALTGFKNICGRIPYLEQNGYAPLFCYEESVGYASCPEIRDKDGISALMLLAEAAAYYKKKRGKTLLEVLRELFEKYGYYAEDEPSIVLKGIEGARRIERMMDNVRQNLPLDVTFPGHAAGEPGSGSGGSGAGGEPGSGDEGADADHSANSILDERGISARQVQNYDQSDAKACNRRFAGENCPERCWKYVAGFRVVKVIDYKDGYEDIPASNVLRFFLENGSWFAVRPSGTEPKIKFYFYSKQESRQMALDVNARIRDWVMHEVISVR